MMFERKKHRPRVEIVPMIDVIFFLLIFFMFFTTFKTAVSGIPLELPESKQGVDLEQSVVVSIDKNGHIYYGSELVSLNRLITNLQPLVTKDPGLLVVINADSKVNYGKLIEVMDALSSAGVNMPALGVEKAKKLL